MIGAQELKDLSNDLSVPSKAKVALALFDRKITHAFNIIRYGGLCALVILLSVTVLLEYTNAYAVGVAVVITIGSFFVWLNYSTDKMRDDNRSLVSDLGYLTAQTSILFDQEGAE